MRLICLMLTGLMPLTIQAAISKQKAPVVSAETVSMALNLPPGRRVAALTKQGATEVTPVLIGILYDPKASVSMRWKALNALAGLAPGPQTVKLVEDCLRSKEWMLRNAGLFAMQRLDSVQARAWALRLLADKALVVRTAAVKVLSVGLKANERQRLWQALSEDRNFHSGHSLWIRKHIVRALSQQPQPGEEKRFVDALKDEDERLHRFAMQGLDRLTGSSTQKKDNRRAQWLDWWQQRRL